MDEKPKEEQQDEEYYDYYDEEDDLAKEAKDPDKPIYLVEHQKDKKGTEEVEIVK